MFVKYFQKMDYVNTLEGWLQIEFTWTFSCELSQMSPLQNLQTCVTLGWISEWNWVTSSEFRVRKSERRCAKDLLRAGNAKNPFSACVWCSVKPWASWVLQCDNILGGCWEAATSASLWLWAGTHWTTQWLPLPWTLFNLISLHLPPLFVSVASWPAPKGKKAPTGRRTNCTQPKPAWRDVFSEMLLAFEVQSMNRMWKFQVRPLSCLLCCSFSAGWMGDDGLWRLFPPLDTAPTPPVHQFL